MRHSPCFRATCDDSIISHIRRNARAHNAKLAGSRMRRCSHLELMIDANRDPMLIPRGRTQVQGQGECRRAARQ